MNRNNIFEKVQQIFRDVFDNQKLTIVDSSTAESIDDWDSLNHINLIVGIEKEFDIKFSLNEVTALKDVGEMINLINHKVQIA